MSALKSFEPDRLYPRCTELEDGRELNVYQSEMGDVGCVVWDAAIVLGKFYEHISLTKGLDYCFGKECGKLQADCHIATECETTDNVTLKGLKTVIERCAISGSGSKIFELGSGTGYVGMVAAAYGADVTITDLPEFVELMEYNIGKNQYLIDERCGKCSAKELTWGTEPEAKADLILMADCIYYEQSLKSLIKTMVDLSKPETLIVCCHEERTTENKPRLQKQFFDDVIKCFSIKRVPTDKQHSAYSSDDIHINILQLLSDQP